MSSWGARVLLVDATAYDPLRITWRLGHLITARGRFTHRLYVRSWNEAMKRLCELAKHEQLSEVQVWGHGSVGRALIGADVFDADYVRSSSYFKRWAALRPFQQHPSPLIWFRTCYTMKGEAGRTFATLLTHALGCRVAGYTQYIHVVQRGLVVAWPDKPPRWSDEAAAGARVWFCTFSPASLAPLWGCPDAELLVSTADG
jgi:hypothetical protein